MVSAQLKTECTYHNFIHRTTLVCSTNSKREGSGELCIQAVSCRTVQCGTITLQYFVTLHDCLSSNNSLWKWWELGILSTATEAVKTFQLYFLGSVLTLKQVNSRVHYLISGYIIQLIAFQWDMTCNTVHQTLSFFCGSGSGLRDYTILLTKNLEQVQLGI